MNSNHKSWVPLKICQVWTNSSCVDVSRWIWIYTIRNGEARHPWFRVPCLFHKLYKCSSTSLILPTMLWPSSKRFQQSQSSNATLLITSLTQRQARLAHQAKVKAVKICLSCRTSNRQLSWFFHQTGTWKEVIFLWCCRCCSTVHSCVVGQSWHCQTFQDVRASIITAFAEAGNF